VATILAVVVGVKGADRADPAAMAMSERDLKETILIVVGEVFEVKGRVILISDVCC
jgi:hypothetical protein